METTRSPESGRYYINNRKFGNTILISSKIRMLIPKKPGIVSYD